MLTLTDINRALDRLGVEAFLPRTRREVAGSLLTSSRRTAPAATLPGRHRPGSIYGRPYGFREQVQDSTNAPCLAAIEAGPVNGEPQPIRPSRVPELLRNDEARPPEQRLMIAVLAATWPFSFVVICETLDLEPEDIRAGLRAWRAAHASGVERGGRMIRTATSASAPD